MPPKDPGKLQDSRRISATVADHASSNSRPDTPPSSQPSSPEPEKKSQGSSKWGAVRDGVGDLTKAQAAAAKAKQGGLQEGRRERNDKGIKAKSPGMTLSPAQMRVDRVPTAAMGLTPEEMNKKVLPSNLRTTGTVSEVDDPYGFPEATPEAIEAIAAQTRDEAARRAEIGRSGAYTTPPPERASEPDVSKGAEPKTFVEKYAPNGPKSGMSAEARSEAAQQSGGSREL